jgi:hypothetical protein
MFALWLDAYGFELALITKEQAAELGAVVAPRRPKIDRKPEPVGT